MRIKNTDIYNMIAELWNAEARATDAREQAWCAESVQAEVRASGMTPYEALQGAVSVLCIQYVATVARCHRIEYWDWDDATDDDEDCADDDEDCADDDDDDDDDVVYEEDDDGDGDYVDEENEEDEDGYGI